MNKRIFSKLFTIAETGNLSKEEYHMYEASLKQKWDLQNAMDFAVKKARAEEAKIILKKVAKRLKAKGLSLEIISETTELKVEEIEKL